MVDVATVLVTPTSINVPVEETSLKFGKKPTSNKQKTLLGSSSTVPNLIILRGVQPNSILTTSL